MKYDFVFIGAHPDDVILACGGTIGKLSEKGYKCMVVSLTSGENGCKEYGVIRTRELYNSAICLKTDFRVLDLIDTHIVNTPYEQEMLKSLFLECDPYCIFCHNSNDVHFDHLITNDIVKKSIAMYLTANSVSKARLRGMFTYQVIKINPKTVLHNEFDYYCDITDYITLKEKAVNFHVSQEPYIKNNLELIRLYNSFYGKMVGCEYAECYKYHPLSYENSLSVIEELFDWRE